MTTTMTAATTVMAMTMMTTTMTAGTTAIMAITVMAVITAVAMAAAVFGKRARVVAERSRRRRRGRED
jgi:hypothetical protein